MDAHIQVKKPGLMTTIQDDGRYGYQKYGVVVSGAIDSYAAKIANLLVGNIGHESVMEITLQGPILFFMTDVLIAVCGGDLSPSVGSEPIPLWRPLFMKAGTTLQFGAAKTGCRSYLAIAGGFDVPDVLGSKSTFLRGGFGGYLGRSLREGDILSSLPRGALSKALTQSLKQRSRNTEVDFTKFVAPNWSLSPELFSYIPASNPSKEISVRVLTGQEYDLFDSESQARFVTSPYQVTTRSDRMGCRLLGTELFAVNTEHMLSDAVTVGTIQVPPDGQPIILLADRQTTGGYPRIAQVVSVDLAVVGQTKPGVSVSFQSITLADAQLLYIKRMKELENLKWRISYLIRNSEKEI